MRLPSSGSEADAEQVKVVPVTTFELGEMETLEIEGGLLVIVPEVEALSEPP